MTREETIDGERVSRLFAVYEMLEGEDKYTWISNRLTDKEFENGARVLARFHALAHDFDPGDLAREQPPIMEFVRRFPELFEDFAAQSRGTAFDEHYLEKLPQHPRGRAPRHGDGGRPSRDAPGPRALRLPSRQPQVGRRAGRRPLRLRLVQAGLPALRRGAGHRLLLQLLGGSGRRRGPARTRRPSSSAPTRTRRRASTSPARWAPRSSRCCRAWSPTPICTSSTGTWWPTTRTPAPTSTSTWMYLDHQLHFMEYIEAHQHELAHIAEEA